MLNVRKGYLATAHNKVGPPHVNCRLLLVSGNGVIKRKRKNKISQRYLFTNCTTYRSH